MGNGTIYKRGNIYWVKVYQHGRPLYESSKSPRFEDAKNLLQRLQGDVARGVRITSEIHRLTATDALARVLEEYAVQRRKSTSDAKGRIENHLTPFFGTCRLSAISKDDLRKYILKRQGQGAKNATINRELALLSKAYGLTDIPRPKIPHLEERNVRKGFFEPAQFAAVSRHLSPPLKAAVTIAYVTGWRVRSEVLRLEWRHLDLAGRGEIRLDPDSTKNSEPRVFRLTTELRGILEAQRADTEALQRETGAIIRFVFHRHGKQIKDFRRAWRAACKAAGCPGMLRHDMRRSGVRNMVRAGIAERVAMQLAGHKTRSVFDRYNIVSEGDLEDAAMKLNNVTVTKTVTGTVDRAGAVG